jgi:hypothetical protein
MQIQKTQILILILGIFLISLVSAGNLNLFPNPNEANVYIAYVFNFSNSTNCLSENIILSYNETVLTNSRGFGYVSINISNLSSVPLRLCEYKDGVLRKNHSFSDIIFNTINARSLNLSGNVTLNYIFGNGSQLDGVCLQNGSNCPSGITDTQKGTFGIYLYNDSTLIYFNESRLNNTIDDRASGLGDNESWNQSLADNRYLFQDGSAELTSNWVVGAFNITASWFKGAFDWVINAVGISPKYLSFNGTDLTFNETQLNVTIDDRDDTIGNCSGDLSCSNIIYQSELPLANKTRIHCSNITGATSDLCTITPGAGGGLYADGTYLYNDSTKIYFNTTLAGANLSVNSSDFWDNYHIPTDLNNLLTLHWANITSKPTHLSNFTDNMGITHLGIKHLQQLFTPQFQNLFGQEINP